MAEGAIGRGLAAVGRGVGDIGQVLFRIELEKQEQENAAAIASGASDLNKLIGKELENVQLEVMQTRNQAEERMINISDAYDIEVKRVTGDMNKVASLQFMNSAITAKEGKLASIRNTLRLKQLDFNKNDTLRQYSNTFETLAKQEVPVNDILNHPDVKLTDNNMRPYWRAGEQERQKNIILADSLTNPDIGRYDDAEELIQKTKGLLPTEKNAKLNNIRIAKDRADRKFKDLGKIADMQVNEDFMSKIITKDLEPDEIVESRLEEGDILAGFEIGKRDVLTQQLWLNYAKESFKSPPEKSLPEGINAMLGVVIEFSGKEFSKEAAYRRLLDIRYKNKAITNDRFLWAIDKINNPYPIPIAADVRAVTNNNIETFKNIGFNFIFPQEDRQKASEVNENLVLWIDRQIELGKEPTWDDMQDKSKELIVGDAKKTVPPTIVSREEYDALPVGAVFIDSNDGRSYVKR